MNYRYVIADSHNPYRNLALEQALFSSAKGDTVVVYLWQNDNTIVIGRNQDLRAECRLEEFLQCGGTPARRRSGGGAVWHDLGNLNYSVICQNSLKQECRYYDLICALMRQYGLDAKYNGRNDIVIDDRKISGNAEYTNGEINCCHGTILIRSDLASMERFLTPAKEKLQRNRIESVRARVANLSEYIPWITPELVIHGMIEMFHMEKMSYPPKENEIKKWEIFFENKQWIYGGVE